MTAASRRCIPGLAAAALAVALASTGPAGQNKSDPPKKDDPLAARIAEYEKSVVKKKLDEAKADYAGAAEKFKAAVADSFDRREEAARKAGNKKAVDQVKKERDMFEAIGDPPATAPRQSPAAARGRLAQAYAAAVKEYTRLKLDDLAAAAEKEQQAFQLSAALLTGKRTYLSTLKPTDVRVWGNVFEPDTSKYQMDRVAIPHSVYMHPSTRGDASASYQIPGKAFVFRAVVGVPRHTENQGDPASPLTFEVLGDGKSLWKSNPVNKMNVFQRCAFKVEKVKTLTLHVRCPEDLSWAHAIWFAPALIEP